ncbi:MAG TPA: septal ring lytic transglycosylase RlpA family protein [Stellaceae bacterium]|nr:septal ring lytic transglycosylase RlpA family protein [Stellaceae bacterium]
MRTASLIALMMVAVVAGCAAPVPPPPTPATTAVRPRFSEQGVASTYGHELNQQRTASGEPFDPNGMTAAHRSLPFNTIVRVTNLDNGQSVRVRINDRGPFVAGRIIDLSAKAARSLGMREDSTARVRLDVFEADQSASL